MGALAGIGPPEAVPFALEIDGEELQVPGPPTAGMVLHSEYVATTAAEALSDGEVALLPTGSTELHGALVDLLAGRAFEELRPESHR